MSHFTLLPLFSFNKDFGNIKTSWKIHCSYPRHDIFLLCGLFIYKQHLCLLNLSCRKVITLHFRNLWGLLIIQESYTIVFFVSLLTLTLWIYLRVVLVSYNCNILDRWTKLIMKRELSEMKFLQNEAAKMNN